MAHILDGKAVSESIAKRLKEEVSLLEPKLRFNIVQVGTDSRSEAYIKRKIAFGEKVGVEVIHTKLDESTTEEVLISHIKDANRDSAIHGIIVQLPLPNHLNKDHIIDTISSRKDVDGLTRESPFTPATARGVISLLKYYQIPIKDKLATVVGRSNLVGKPVALLLEQLGAEVSVAHRETRDLGEMTRGADILVVATGVPKLIGKECVSSGQTVVDVGISVEEDGKLVGDVVFDEVESVVEHITPVPGGVGPMTVASLFENLLDAYRNQVRGQ